MAKKKIVAENDVARQVRNCRLFYKLGLVPTEEELDPIPLTVPLGCETPLTRKEMFQMFGYGSFSNPNLYDDEEDGEEWDDGNSYTEFPLSKDEIVTDDGQTLRELEVSLKQDEDALKDKLFQDYLEAQKSASADGHNPTADGAQPAGADNIPVE